MVTCADSASHTQNYRALQQAAIFLQTEQLVYACAFAENVMLLLFQHKDLKTTWTTHAELLSKRPTGFFRE